MNRAQSLLYLLATAFSLMLGPGPMAPDHLMAGNGTWRVSVASNGGQGNDLSHSPTLSANGRFVVFRSEADNLVPDDTNNATDVFVHDNQTGETIRASVASDGTEGNDISIDPTISADGRYVGFISGASNLVADDTNDCSSVYEQANCFDAFVHDRHTGEISRVSVASDGAQANGGSLDISLSADGRYVAFASAASNLVPNDTAICYSYDGTPYNCTDVFVHDRQTGQTILISVNSSGDQANRSSSEPVLSANGRFVAFRSEASNLVSGDTNSCQGYPNCPDVFVHDRQTGETIRVSVASDGTQSTKSSSGPSISGDGRFVTFTGFDGTLVPNDMNHAWDVFIHDRQTAETRLVSVAPDGSQAQGSSTYSALTPDGRYVIFASRATNLIAGDTQEAGVVVRNLETGEVTRVSLTTNGTPAAGTTTGKVSISADGRVAAFVSESDGVVPGDTNESTDVFVHDRGVFNDPSLTLGINHQTGATGSTFALSGNHFPANDMASVRINGREVGAVATDEKGDLRFQLATTNAGEGIYFVAVNVYHSAAVTFALDHHYPVRPQEGDAPIFEVPAGIALSEAIFLPSAFAVMDEGP